MLKKYKRLAISLIFVFFLNSGSLKWMSFWPIDTTVLFGLFCVIIIFIRIGLNQKKEFKTPFVIKIFFFLIFWIFISCIYTPSYSYYLEKFSRTLLLIISLLFPLFIFKDKDWIFVLREAFSVFGILGLILLTVVYLKGGFSLNNYFLSSSDPGSNIPDYLTIGQIFGVFFFINLSRNTPFWILIKIWAFLMMIMLGGRGPILFLIMFLILNYIIKSRFTFKNIIKWTLISVVSPFLVTAFFNWSGSEKITNRFENITQGDASLAARRNLIKESFDLIEVHPFFGVGYGGFGITVENKDSRSYPHNILLEIFVETGIIGFIIFVYFYLCFFSTYFRRLYLNNRNNIYVDLCLSLAFVFIQSLKSSSVIDVRLLIGLTGIIIVCGMFSGKPIFISIQERMSNRIN